jgi:hypothetical protein
MTEKKEIRPEPIKLRYPTTSLGPRADDFDDEGGDDFDPDNDDYIPEGDDD